MKELILLLLYGAFAFQGCTQPAEMTTELWNLDVEYLDRKIQKEFTSYIPGVKATFSAKIAALKKQIPNLKDYEIACEIQRILSLLQDGHTELNVGHNTVGFHRVPLSLYFFGDDLRVIAAHKEFEDFIGAKIVGIGKHETNEAYNLIKGNMSRDNEMEYLYAAPGYLILTELLAYLDISASKDEVTFKFELSNGQEVSHNFKGLNSKSYGEGDWSTLLEMNRLEPPLYLSKTGSYYWHKYLPDHKTMYLNFTRVNNQKGMPSIKKFTRDLFSEIDKLKPIKLIIDFRLNNGGNYNLSRPLIESIKSRNWLNQKGKIWAITGRRTFSAASVACIFLIQETETQLIGEPGRTHPNQSDNNEYMTLPNSRFLIEYTTKIKIHWPEKPDLDRVPVDVNLPPSFESYKQGIDPVMDYLLKN